MSLRIPPKAECYSNACHHALIDDTYSESFEQALVRHAREMLDAFYLAELQLIAEVPKDELQRAKGTRLLRATKQKALQRLANAA